MNIQRFLFGVEVVQAGLHRGKDVVRLEANNVVQEATELVKLALDLNDRASILLHEVNVAFYL